MDTLDKLSELVKRNAQEHYSKAAFNLEKYLERELPNYKFTMKGEVSPEEEFFFLGYRAKLMTTLSQGFQ